MNDYIRSLDSHLAVSGEDIILRRIVGAAAATQVNLDVTVRANTRKVKAPAELVNGITQDDLRVIISPTQIANAQWPGGGIDKPEPFNPDRSIPKKLDRLIVKGVMFTVEMVDAISVNDEVVRIVMFTKGGASGA